MRFREGAPLTIALVLSSSGACTNDYGSLDFTGGVASDGATSGTGGATGGSTSASGGSGGIDGGSGGSTSTPADAATGGSIDASSGGAAGAPAIDAAIEASVESGPPEGGTPDGPAPSCDDRYGSVAGYVLCSERSSTCTFAARTDGMSCSEVCEAFGGQCLDAADNAGNPCNVVGPEDDCNTRHMTEICICTR